MKGKTILSDFLISFGAVIKTKRLSLGLSQEELADRSGLHRTYITDIERGARNITLKNVKKISEALQISLSDLFSRVESRHS
jgi:transcriptional regulator with XRE-family HTH domain